MSVVDRTEMWKKKVDELEGEATSLAEALQVAVECLKKIVPPGEPISNERSSVGEARKTLEKLKTMGIKI